MSDNTAEAERIADGLEDMVGWVMLQNQDARGVMAPGEATWPAMGAKMLREQVAEIERLRAELARLRDEPTGLEVRGG